MAYKARPKTQNTSNDEEGGIQIPLFAVAIIITAATLATSARTQDVKALSNDQPDRFASVLLAGDQARTAGELSSAEALYKEATILSPRSIDGWLRLGLVQLRSNELLAAAESYRAAQTIDDMNADVAFALGQIALRFGKTQAAIDELEVGLRGHPDDPQLNYAAGVAYALQRQFDDALEHYRRALISDSQNTSLRTDYGFLQLQTGDAEGARATLELVANSSEATDRARLGLALSYVALGRATEALSAVPGHSESELRQLLSRYYPEHAPTGVAPERALAPTNPDASAVERGSSNPERERAELKRSEKTAVTIGGATAPATRPESGPPSRSGQSASKDQKIAPSGAYRVQLGSERSEERAREESNRLQAQHPDLLGDVSLTVTKAELAQKGTFYRVQAGPIFDLKEAEQRCSRLKMRQVDCFVVRPN